MNRSIVFPLLFAPLLVVAPSARADWPNSPAQAVGIQAGPGDVYGYRKPLVVPDGQGGALVLWSDNRTGDYDVYAQRLDSDGVPQWAAGGITVQGGAGDQKDVVGVPDGVGGAILAFSDDWGGLAKDVRMQRVSASGALLWYPFWVMSASGDQEPTSLTALSNGNVCVAIVSDNSGDYDIWAATCTPGGLPFGPNAVCNLTGSQYAPAVVPDATGGAFLMWNDFRPGPTGNNVFAQRVNQFSSPMWTAGGIQISASGYGNNGLTGVPDGFGGFVVLWNDYDGVYRQVHADHRDAGGSPLSGAIPVTSGAEHFISSALPDGQGGFFMATSVYSTTFYAQLQRFGLGASPLWGPITLNLYGYSGEPTLVGDGDGGVFVGWMDAVSAVAGYDIFVQQFGPEGGAVGSYSPTLVCTAPNQQYSPVLVSDDRGGVIAAWMDAREFWSGNGWDLYANRVARFGRLGAPEARIVSVRDVPNDQGGRLTVRWDRSYLDKASNQQVSAYLLWREVPAAVAQAALARGARLHEDAVVRATAAAADDGLATSFEAPLAGERLFRRAAASAGSGYWEYVGQQAAQGFTGYSMTVSTEGDSVAGSNPATRFMVQTSGFYGHWESDPDSGYSVDNLGPAQPAPFAAVFGGVSTSLHWAANGEADLAGYRLYRGTTPGFVPDGGSFVAAIEDTHYVDAIALPRWYKLVAVDAHGNTSPAALAASSATLDVTPGGAAGLALSRPSPNPARGPVALHFVLPGAGPVRLAIHDAQGRLVRVVAGGDHAAGEHAAAWDGRDEGGARVAPGIYFARLQAAGRDLVRRFVTLD